MRHNNRLLKADLHVHPGNNNLRRVIRAMNKNDIQIVALSELDRTITRQLREQKDTYFPEALMDRKGIFIDGKYIFFAREYSTKENFYLLSIGYTHDAATPNTSMKEIIDATIKNNGLLVITRSFAKNRLLAGHISMRKTEELEEICREYSGNISLEWEGYCRPSPRVVAARFLEMGGAKPEYTYIDVNKEVEIFSDYLHKHDGVNTPVIASSGVNATHKHSLNSIGIAHTRADIEGVTPTDALSSLKEKIFARETQLKLGYASNMHIVANLWVPEIVKSIME